MLSGMLSAKWTTWTVPASGRISTRLEQKREDDQVLGCTRGGFGTKVQLKVEGHGNAAVFVLTPG